MNAMTWYDHETQSIWTQPLGRALTGPLKGTQLKIIPYSLVPWSTWREEHPDTLALIAERGSFRGQEPPTDNFVIGVAIGDVARGYVYPAVANRIVVNDQLGDIPVVVHVNPENRNIHVFSRELNDGTVLTFTGDENQLIDEATGSVFDPSRGIGLAGEYSGVGLRELPYISSFDWAWLDFYPHTDFYTGR